MRALLFACSILLAAACSDANTGSGGDPIDASGNPFQFADGDPGAETVSDGGSTDAPVGDLQGDVDPGQGGVGEPCFDDGTCEDGAMCVNGWCVPDTPPTDAHSGGDGDGGGDPDAAVPQTLGRLRLVRPIMIARKSCPCVSRGCARCVFPEPRSVSRASS